ncbi:MAG TPA: penicillin-insensitive murein endopeptidase [Thermoanaerobaculia bacterium]|nr:penicillin-insensitive murein endopeptidase [Thermoanaerobaculia bacterium]
MRSDAQRWVLPATAAAIALLPLAAWAKSECFGTPERGALRGGCQLPASGANVAAYSRPGVAAGRTYVHCTVADVLVAAYAELQRRHPELRFVYGETGFARGGRFEPHKTHQNGLSVDFFVPLRDRSGKSVPVPTSAANRWGYDLEFDSRGKLGELTIDFEAMAAHLAALQRAAAARGVGIRRVIFDAELQKQLRRTRGWHDVAALTFSTQRGWWRHDEHYHVDFELRCQPL